jgi:hypothetical protein
MLERFKDYLIQMRIEKNKLRTRICFQPRQGRRENSPAIHCWVIARE